MTKVTATLAVDAVYYLGTGVRGSTCPLPEELSRITWERGSACFLVRCRKSSLPCACWLVCQVTGVDADPDGNIPGASVGESNRYACGDRWCSRGDHDGTRCARQRDGLDAGGTPAPSLQCFAQRCGQSAAGAPGTIEAVSPCFKRVCILRVMREWPEGADDPFSSAPFSFT